VVARVRDTIAHEREKGFDSIISVLDHKHILLPQGLRCSFDWV